MIDKNDNREEHFNLLTEPLISVRTGSGGRGSCSLPEVLSLLARDGIEDFPRLRPHQAHPWFAFLVQLGAIVSHRQGWSQAPEEPSVWAHALRELAGGDDAPFCLVVSDLSKPAFFQPPVPEGSLKKFKPVAVPDGLDMLITSKNHDLKMACIVHTSPEYWIFSLFTLQTMQGFLGSGNYGIARMNGGFASRPCVTYAPSTRWGARFLRDLRVLLTQRDEIVTHYGFKSQHGIALVWLDSWNGTTSLSLEKCDPFFIEICRRVRLTHSDNRITAVTKSTKTARLDAKSNCGDTGDPWTPIEREGGKALTVSSAGFHYKLIQKLLFGGDYVGGASQRIYGKDSQDMSFVSSVMVRGKGKTEGFHERILPLPPRARAILGGSPSDGEPLAAMAKDRVGIVDTVRKRILHPALCALLQAGRDKLDLKDDRTSRWKERLDREVDLIFFERLWRDMDSDNAEVSVLWSREVVDLARSILESAFESTPVPAISRYKAISAALSVFNGATRKKFPDLFNSDSQGGGTR